MFTSLQTITATVDDGVARLTLTRPDAGNAIDLQVARELAEVTTRWATDPTVRVVVLRGAGARFCVGGDLRSFEGVDDLPHLLAEITGPLHVALSNLARMAAPVVCGVQGSAAGAGMSLAAAADITVAARSARFVFAYTAIGLSPDGSGSWHVPRAVGLKRALDLALTNRPLTAAEAEAWGLVSRVVDDEQLDAEVETIAAALADGSTTALGATKRLLREAADRELEAQMAAETEALVRCAATDGREGLGAFLAKRPPRFR